MSTERQKKAFALLPYKIEPEYRGTDIGKYSECWSRCEDNSARYMLSYVAKRINNDAFDRSICTYRKLKDGGKSVKAYVPNDKTQSFRTGNVSYYQFSTGIILFAVELIFSGMDYREMAAALYEIKEQKHSGSYIIENASDVTFDLYKFADELIAETKLQHVQSFSSYTSSSHQRINILSCYETEPEELDGVFEEAMFLLSHNYHGNFKYYPDTDDTYDLYRNNNVCHWGITAETCACVVYPDENNDFVEKVFRNNFSSCYLLMFAMILNQKFTLYDFLETISNGLFARTGDSYIEAEKYRNDFYLFEQNYNFHIITEVPQYQNIYNLMYKRMSIDKLIGDVKEPLDAINSILMDEHERAERDSDKKTERTLTILSVFAIFSALTDSWAFITELKPILLGEASLLDNLWQIIVSFLIVVIYIILAGNIVFHTAKNVFKK